MPKIKLKSIKSNNVKLIFRSSVYDREEVIKNLTLTNDEIVEATKLIIEEFHGDRTVWLRLIVTGQKGPFNHEVFDAMMNGNGKWDHLGDSDLRKHMMNSNIRDEALKQLMSKTANPSDTNKIQWINIMIATAKDKKEMLGLFAKNTFASYGINVKEKPCNATVLTFLVDSVSKNVIGDYTREFDVPEETLKSAIEILNSMTEQEQIEWLEKTTIVEALLTILLENPKTSKGAIRYVFETAHKKLGTDIRDLFLQHKNFPDSLSLKMYNETGDTSFLTGPAAKFFAFPE